jgi:hypothetical protein
MLLGNDVLSILGALPHPVAILDLSANGRAHFLNKAFSRVFGYTIEVVLLFRPDCSPVKVDQVFLSGCHSHGFGLVGMDLIRGQDAVGRVGPIGIVIGQPFSNLASSL